MCSVCWLFLAMIRTYLAMYAMREWITPLSACVLLRGFFATTRKHVRRENQVKQKNDIAVFARNKYTVTVNGISVSWLCALNS